MKSAPTSVSQWVLQKFQPFSTRQKSFRLPATCPLPCWRGRVRVGVHVAFLPPPPPPPPPPPGGGGGGGGGGVARCVSNPHPSPPPCIGGRGRFVAISKNIVY
ncbi:hypothetical protein SAMN02746062_01054 [Alysiella filiformis DSM 16848]|uniref:Uncharacterized protein n=1 Tax=Alysiella filiformis DSM 16848 TaxID=1120981 RepID=A0A286EAK4_9NEIS|nr:hypothetical protein SAMN02746062_01054 [Alysiella filiformis DSM 16848]